MAEYIQPGIGPVEEPDAEYIMPGVGPVSVADGGAPPAQSPGFIMLQEQAHFNGGFLHGTTD